MKYNIAVACAAALSLAVFSTQAHDGRVYVTGTITDNTCTLSPDSQDMTVDMGAVSNRQFLHPGEGANWQSFVIDLQNCGATAIGVTVSFNGAANTYDHDLLALTPGAGAAAGIGIALYDHEKKAIPLGSESALIALSANQASAQLQFYARYIADGGAVMSGVANASATFILNYE